MTTQLKIDKNWEGILISNTKNEKILIFLNKNQREITFHPPFKLEVNPEGLNSNFKESEKTIIEAFFSFYNMNVMLETKEKIIEYMKIEKEDFQVKNKENTEKKSQKNEFLSKKREFESSFSDSDSCSDDDFVVVDENIRNININKYVPSSEKDSSSSKSSSTNRTSSFNQRQSLVCLPICSSLNQIDSVPVTYETIEIDDPRVPVLYSSRISPYNFLQKYVKLNRIRLNEESTVCNDTIDKSSKCKYIISTNNNNKYVESVSIKSSKKEARESAAQTLLKKWFPDKKWKDLVDYIV